MVTDFMSFYQTQEERCEVLAAYLIEHHATVRKVAHVFAVSKSTVHKDITVRLRHINPTMYANAKNILEQNKSERHLRGGEATRQKYIRNKCAQIQEKTSEKKATVCKHKF